MKTVWGSILYGLAKFIDIFFSLVIAVMAGLVSVGQSLRLVIGGCFFSIPILIFPLSLAFFSNPYILTILFLAFVVPLLGKPFISLLEYGKYVLTEYLYDQSDYYRLGKNSRKDFQSYGARYYRKKQREEYEQRRRAQQEYAKYWEEVFRNFTSSGYGGYYQGGAGYGSQQSDYGRNYGSQGYQGGYQNSGYQQYNPMQDFRRKYEEACQTLGVSFQTDEYEVKLAYRKLAKKYHPDINKEPGATQMFQKVNDAYEFLSKENIERYKNMGGR